MTSTDAQKAVDRLDKSVNAKIDARNKMVRIIAPHLQAWLARRNQEIGLAGESLPKLDFAKSDNWETLMETVGNLYTTQHEFSGNAMQQTKGLLAYVWRVTFEFPSSVGLAERETLKVTFGLINKETGTENKAQLKKLNATSNRPLCVMQSVMAGEVPFKRDEVLGSFVSAVIKNNHTFTDEHGKRIKFDHAHMRDFISTQWQKIKGLKNKTELMEYFTVSCSYSLTEAQKRENTDLRREERTQSVGKDALGKGGHAWIDAQNLRADAKAQACGILEQQAADMGLYPVRASFPLYHTLTLLLGKSDVNESTISDTIVELTAVRSRLKQQRRELIDTGIASSFICAAKRAIDAKLVTVKDTGSTVELTANKRVGKKKKKKKKKNGKGRKNGKS